MRIKRLLGRFLLNNFYRNIRTQIAIVLSIVITIPVVLLGVSLIDNSHRAVKKSVLSNHKEIVARAAEEISLILKRSEDVLSATAAMIGSTHLGAWQQETVLVGLTLDKPAFIRITSFELSGKMTATSDLGKFFVLNYTDNIVQKPLAGQTYISEVRFQDSNHLPYLGMSVPIRENGKVKGILAADINLRSLWDVVDAIRIGTTGRAFLVSGDGIVIASPDKKQVLKNENIRWQKDVNAALFGKNEAAAFIDPEGKKWISSYAPVPDTDWGIVLRQGEREAYSFSRVMQWQAWLIIIFCELAALLAAALLSRLFSRPVRMLLSRLKSAGSSDSEYKIGIKRHDELGELIKVFNALGDKLKIARANEKFSSIGEAAAWVAHELKNSLAPIKSFVQMLPSRYTDGKFIDKFQDIVPEEIMRCERMLKELSDFSSSAELKARRINLKDVIDGALKTMEARFTDSGIDVRLQADTTNLYIHGDHDKLKQVFINLFINALGAMPHGGSINLAMRIARSIYAKGDFFVEVNIGDTGTGIPRERLTTIFEPFRSTKKDGMGLGLAISRRIIEQHGGEVLVESQLDKGTIFTIRIPQADPGAKETPEIPSFPSVFSR
ncbi:MAG: cache domain-containing protein [Candidatus Omnitrophota bacterium]